MFEKGLKDPGIAQQDILKRVICEVTKIDHYRQYGDISTCNFKEKIPISDYEDIQLSVKKSLNGKNNAIVFGKVKLFEKTSGSSGGSKYIPYTNKALIDFYQTTLIWIYDIITHHKSLKTFKMFLSISPSFQEKEENVSLENDDEYFPYLFRKLLSRILLIPKNLKQIKTPEEYDRNLLSFLVEQKDLEIISIWSPSYLLVYLEKLEADYSDLRHRAKRELPEKLDLNLLWPHLKFISVWGDDVAEEGFQKIKEIFPKIQIQKKGLLSTEFPVTIPLLKNPKGHYPLLQLVYFEFIKDGHSHSLLEVKKNGIYTLVLSKPGGFIRYNTHDRVKIIDFDGRVPILEFVGRDGIVSDLVGEKLNATFVEETLKLLLRDQAYLMACYEGDEYFYTLFANQETNLSQLEQKLCQNVHYNYARKIGQLKDLKQVVCKSPNIEYIETKRKNGMKLGDIKFSYLMKLEQKLEETV